MMDVITYPWLGLKLSHAGKTGPISLWIWVMHLPIFFVVAPLTVGLSYDRIGASKVTLKEMGTID